MKRLLLAVTLVACKAEPIDVYEPDAGTDAAPIACRASLTLPDRKLCVGHDEDCDGVPDACDECPGLAGTSCSPPFGGPWKRAFFDSFALEASRTDAGVRAIAGAHPMQLMPDYVLGGVPNGEGSSDAPMMVFGLAPRATNVSATTVFRMNASAGIVGLVVRVVGVGSVRFAACLADFRFVPRVVAMRSPDAGCDGTRCPLTDDEAATAGLLRATRDIPSWSKALAAEPLGLRATVVDHRFECRAFRPDMPETWSSDAAATLDLPDPIEAGDVGFVARHVEAELRWLDVLVAAP